MNLLIKRVWKAIRYSSIGTFFAGIVFVIQGCTVEREGALAFILLFLLQFCSGPMEESTEMNTIPPMVLDPFTTVQFLIGTCDLIGNNLGVSPDIVFGQRQFLYTDTFNNPKELTFNAGSGMLTVSADGNGGPCGPFILYPNNTFNGTPVDISEYNTLRFTVISMVNTINNCRTRFQDTGAHLPFWDQAVVDNTTTEVTVPLPATLDKTNFRGMDLFFCDFDNNVSITIGPLELIP